MKKVSLTLIAVALALTTLIAQAPQSFNYQGVARDNTGNVLPTQPISIRISILSGSPTGTNEYAETHSITTNQFGLFNLEIGNGTLESGNFTTIDWGSNAHYVKIEMDETGGTAYQLMGTSQLLSVPYALHAENVTNDNVDDADADPTNELQVLTISNDTIYLTNGGFITLPAPVTETDPVFGSSVAGGITGTDTTNWNNKLESYTETDPIFGSSVAGGITGTDTTNWNNKLDSYTETDPVFGSSVAGGITGADTTNWNNKLDIEVDGSVTNELQSLSISNDTIYLSNDGFVKLPADADADSTNEIQNLSLSGDTLFLSNGNYILLGSLIKELSWSCGDNFTDDRDGKTYKTVKIGAQCWMAENLNYGTYVTIATGQGAAGTQKYCYGDNTANCTTYGGLYEWTEQMDGAATSNTVPSGVQGVCPTGWHIPSDAEWCLVENAVEAGTNPGCGLMGWRGTNTGGYLKQTGTTNWITPNTGATNSSGFTALPGGDSWAGSFSNVSSSSYWWSSTEFSGTSAWCRYLGYTEARSDRNYYGKLGGFSVRCVQD